MSTSATIQIAGVKQNIQFTHDGYPQSVVPFLEEVYEKAEENKKNKDDTTITDELILIWEKEYGEHQRTSPFRSEGHEYKLEKDGTVLWCPPFAEEFREATQENIEKWEANR